VNGGASARRFRRLAVLALASCGAGIAAISAAEPAMKTDSPSLYASHHESGRYFNPWARQSVRFLDLLKWQLFSRNPYDKSAPLQVPRVANDGAGLAGVEHSATVTWVGHATFAVHDEGDVFLTDPHFGARAMIPRRLVPPGIPIESVPDHAFAVVSHNHYDHLDAWSVDHLPEAMPWFVPIGLGEWFRKRGRANVVELDWWQSAQHGRFTITCLPSQHWSRRVEHGANETLWCSWLVDSGQRRYFFAGDTGYFPGFAEFGQRFGPIDVAMLPIGAYEPRWFMQYQHMDPAEAYQAFLDLRAQHMIAMHWGTFDLTDEPADLPPRVLAEAVRAKGGDASRTVVLAIGEQWHVPTGAAKTP
jgi:N-acyl-phosphatidylethanolamine-hydrolysing phospholipase D